MIEFEQPSFEDWNNLNKFDLKHIKRKRHISQQFHNTLTHVQLYTLVVIHVHRHSALT